MLDAFFNIQYRGNTWFDGLAISEHPEYDAYKNAFPVIYLDLKDSKSEDVQSFEGHLRHTIKSAYRAHKYLLDSDALDEFEKSDFREVLAGVIPHDNLIYSIPELCRMLRAHHRERVIVLIDEYDRAVSDAFGDGSHRPIMDMLGSFLSAILKGNANLKMAYVTGVMQIASESIFSGLNNLSMDNIFSDGSDERFGFTESEVKELLSYYGHPEKFEEAREWYDGYRFGDAEVYNPFSIMNYVSKGFALGPYWVNTGRDNIIRWLLERVDTDNFPEVMSVTTGGSVSTRLDTSLTYSDLGTSADALYSLMVMSGYLKAVPRDGDIYLVSVPNREVLSTVARMIGEMCPIDDRAFASFNRAILDCDAGKMTSELQNILMGGSYLNLTTELHYEVMMMTAMYGMLPSYDVSTESERGNGRVDIILRPKREGTIQIIMELKKVDSERKLDDEAQAAIRQIHDRRYFHGMKGEVILAGMAFCGKVPRVVIETIVV